VDRFIDRPIETIKEAKAEFLEESVEDVELEKVVEAVDFLEGELTREIAAESTRVKVGGVGSDESANGLIKPSDAEDINEVYHTTICIR
jgi:hypothetical protein